MKTIAFKTVGCRLNQAESSSMAAQFEAAGYTIVASAEQARVVVIHSCAITAKAERTCLRAARSAKRANPSCTVVMAGCAVELEREKLLEDPAIDLVADQSEKTGLPTLVRAHFGDPPPSLLRHAATRPSHHPRRKRALVKVQDGCDFGCTYCIVPHTRGKPTSRPVQDVVTEAIDLQSRGYREIVLTGANLGLYSCHGRDLVALIRAIEDKSSIERIRLSSIESTTVEKGVVSHMAHSTRLCRFLHIPLQSGDAGILKAMGRKYAPDDYRRAIEGAVEAVPGLGLGADIIVGFPGEDDKAFSNTMALVGSLPFSNLHVFPYSKRPHTRAGVLPLQVPEQDKKARVREITALGAIKRRQFAQSFVGRTVSVLVEAIRADGVAIGWTGEYLETHLRSPGLRANDIASVPVESSNDAVLLA